MIVRIMLFFTITLITPVLTYAKKEESCASLVSHFLSVSTNETEVNFPKSEFYSYTRNTNNKVTITWQKKALDAVSKQCNKETAREKIKNEINQIEQFKKLSEEDPYSWLYREMIIEFLNKKIVPDFGIVEISFSNSPSSNIPISIAVNLKSICGYTISYEIDKKSLTIKGVYIK